MAANTSVRSDLGIDGMTCAACASRVQQHLDKVDGVSGAQVNFATGRATVLHDGSLDEATLSGHVQSLGYGVIESHERDGAQDRREQDLRRRVIVGLTLAIPAMAIGTVSCTHLTLPTICSV